MSEPTPQIDIRSAGPVRPAQGEVLGKSLREWRRLTATELGVPHADNVVGAGHQAEFWHPGILAKYIWADELARRSNAAVVHLLVDTDLGDPMALRVPVKSGDSLRVINHTFGEHHRGRVALSYPAGQPQPFPLRLGAPAPESVAVGLSLLEASMRNAAAASDAAVQVWLALREVLASKLKLFAHAPTVPTSTLMQTSLGKALLQRAVEDPDACGRAFNNALQLASHAAQPLHLGPSQGYRELPFWLVHPSGERVRLRVDARASCAPLLQPGERLAPTALLTTAIARIGLCDRLVHGLGGLNYERATDNFILNWLSLQLGPIDVVSATMHLPFGAMPTNVPVTPAQHRRAYFDPVGAFDAAGNASEPSSRKQRLLSAIAEQPRMSRERRAAWKLMHAELSRDRASHAVQLEELRARHEQDRAAAAEWQIRADRTWPAPFYPAESLTQMAALVRAAS